MEKLIAYARTLSTDAILATLDQIGGAFDVSKELRISRAALIEVFQEREGEEAADNLMELLGM